MAIGSMTTNSTVDLIDKTLKTENAPADAKATGEALDKKANKDVIYDSDGNIIFYSKAAVDKLLAGKLNLTGGTMSGKILINAVGKDVIKISGSNNTADEEIEFERTDTGAALACGIGAGGDNMGLFDRTNAKWAFHVKSTTGDVYIGGTKCLGFVVASGSDYVRFGDGTQICWGHISFGEMAAYSSTFSTFVFAAPFLNTGYAIMSLQTGDVGSTNLLAVNLVNKTTTNAIVSVYNSKNSSNKAGVIHDCVAIGRWK